MSFEIATYLSADPYDFDMGLDVHTAGSHSQPEIAPSNSPGKRTKIRTRATLGKSGEGNMLGNKLAEAPECLRADGVLSSVAKSVSILHTCKNGSSYALAKHREQEL